MIAEPVSVGLRAAFATVLLAHGLVRSAPTPARLPTPAIDGSRASVARRVDPSLTGVRVPSWAVAALSAAVLLGTARGGPVIGVAMAAVAWVAPRQLRAASRERAGRVFDRALPGLLDAWARNVRGGLAPAAALVDAVAGSGAAVRRALAPVVRSLERGASLEEAVAERWPTRPGPAGPLVTAAVAVSHPLGGLRAQGIDAVAATVREHAGLEAEKHVQAAQARVSAVVMTVAPLLFCAFLVLRDGEASAFLLRSPLGVACGALGVGLDLLAGVWMRTAVRRAS